MFDDLISIFTLPFMQRAMAAGAMLGLVSSYLGAFVVQRGMGFLGDGLAHAAFGGVALGLLLGAEPLSVAIPFTVAVALAITWLKEQARVTADTAIGVFFAVSVALGMVFLSMKKDYTVDAFAYIFGSILTVGETDLLVAALLVLSLGFLLPSWRRWAYASFDRELAETDALPVKRDDYALAAFAAVTVVVAVKILGAVLVSAFLVVPAATAQRLARSFFAMTLWSMALGLGTAILGLALSYVLDLPSGATVVLLQAALFFAASLRQA